MLGSSILSKFFFSFFATGSHVPQVGREYSVQPRMTLNSYLYSACLYISSAGITGVYQTQLNLCLFTQWSNEFSRLYRGYTS